MTQAELLDIIKANSGDFQKDIIAKSGLKYTSAHNNIKRLIKWRRIFRIYIKPYSSYRIYYNRMV